MQFRILPVTAFQQNATLFWCETTHQAVVVDPGGEARRLIAEIQTLGLVPERVLLTHGHLDHVGAAAELAAHYGIPIWGPHLDDAFWIRAIDEQCRMFGFPPVGHFEPDRWLAAGERVEFGEETLEVLHCPGHTPGHLVYFNRKALLAQVGDVLFKGSIGRTDFPRGDHRQLIASIQQGLFPLGDAVRFIPGHGPMSTFGEEMRSNPFVRA